MSATLRPARGRRPVHHLRPRPVRNRPALRLGPDRPQRLRRAAQRPGLHGADRRRLLRRHRGPLPGGPRSVHPGRHHLGRPQRHHPAVPARLLRHPAALPAPRGRRFPCRRRPFPANIAVYNSAPTPVATSYALSAGDVAGPGTSVGCSTVDSFTVPLLAGPPGGLRVGLVTPTGGVRWLPSTRPRPDPATGTPRSTFDLGPTGAGRPGSWSSRVGRRALTVGTPTAVTAEAGAVALDGRMQFGVTSPHWVFTGTLGSFGVFHNTDARGWAWVQVPAGGGPAPAGSSATAPAPARTGTSRSPSTPPGRPCSIRSESWSPGWRATVQPARRRPAIRPPGRPGRARCAVGVIQGVALPARRRLPGHLHLRAPARPWSAWSCRRWPGWPWWCGPSVELAAGRRRRRGADAGRQRAERVSPE